ncbi:Tn7-like element transposition protein TnsE [Kordiimonas aestuarii]|uniref:Tn7-like element transposition protein TnsE n=1 Tax=Kordiimonas aestuarii TaxID=1005925 RepID=UPI0021D247CA|nr:Tn7-like element transposition protein TnsE [Kordiimonas aestuarii]
MTRTTIRSIPNKSQLRHLGNCFRRKESDSRWKIAVRYKVDGRDETKRFDFGLMPVLASRRTYDKDRNPRFISSGYPQTLVLPPKRSWRTATVGDFAKFPKKDSMPEHRHQACFRFEANGLDVWLPALELARALFFPSSYLARLSLQPEGLDGAFYVERPQANVNQIHMLPGANFPKYYLERDDYQIHLAWLLLNSEMRASFGSIARNRMANQVVDGQYARWVFNFDPPNLAGTKVQAVGQFDRALGIFLVYEIAGLSNIDHGIFGDVYFADARATSSSGSSGKTGAGSFQSPADDIEIEDEDEPSVYSKHLIAPTPEVGLAFIRPLTTKKSGSTMPTTSGVAAAGETGIPAVVGSIAEGSIFGGIPQSDFSQLDTSGNLAEPGRKFTQFKKMIDLLNAEESINILESKISPVPELPRHQTHLTSSGERRHYMHVVVQCPDNRICHILEVDTTDSPKSLATKVLELRENSGHVEHIQSIMRRLIKNSLRWPRELLNNLCKCNHSVRHPNYTDLGKDDLNGIAHWSQRILYVLSHS